MKEVMNYPDKKSQEWTRYYEEERKRLEKILSESFLNSAVTTDQNIQKCTIPIETDHIEEFKIRQTAISKPPQSAELKISQEPYCKEVRALIFKKAMQMRGKGTSA